MTACECGPQQALFFCARHGCHKTPHYQRLCETRPEFRAAWERGGGPRIETGDRETTEPALVTAAELPCIFRGPMTRQVGCGHCGAREQLVDVHLCLHFGECTASKVEQRSSERKLHSCLTCEERA